MKALIIIGHPDPNQTLNDFLANSYKCGAEAAGHEVRRIDTAKLSFDPILHHGYKKIQPLESDLQMVQEAIKWCDHLVIIYPNWFITMPALLKGLFDRIWLPGFAFNFLEGKKLRWQKLLAGRSARVIVTMNSIPWLERLFLGDFTNEIKLGILGFAGFRPVRLTKIGPVEGASSARIKYWAGKIERLGQRLK